MEVTRSAKDLKDNLEQLNLHAFFHKIQMHFSKMPSHVFQHAKEGFYQAVFFTFLESSGIKTLAKTTNTNRIDLMTETSNTVYIFELKLDQSEDIATQEKKYKQHFSQKNTLVVGVNFSSKSCNIDKWKSSFYSDGKLIKEILSQKNTASPILNDPVIR